MTETAHHHTSTDRNTHGFAARNLRGLRLILLACFVGGSLGATLFVVPARAQQHGAEPRVIQGRVVGKNGTPVKGAVVYLKDDHTLAIKSFLAADDGTYRFGQLSQSVDYEIWAELNGKKSPTRSVSSFDTKTTVTIELKVDTGN